LPSAADLKPVAPRQLAPSPALRLGWRADLTGPAIRHARLAALAPGDLILLGTVLPAGRLHLPGRRGAVAVTIDAANHLLHLRDEPRQEEPMLSETETLPPSATEGPRFDWNDAPVETVIELTGGTIAAGDLAGLGVGSTLPLPTSGGTLAVKVSAGGLHIADGQLVALGDGFAVLLTAVTDRR
jgi:type III secretion protein Q